MLGAIPKKIMGMYRTVEAIEIRGLVCLKKARSPAREKLEESTFKVWARYQAQLSALRQSPTRAEIIDAVDEKHRQIGTMVLGLADPLPKLKVRAPAADSGERNYQFHSALDDLFELRGHPRSAQPRCLAGIKARKVIHLRK